MSSCAAPGRVQWVEADLGIWDPGTPFDLVTTHYAHPAMPQLAFYDRIAGWVAPGGTLLIVGHRHASATARREDGDQHGHGHGQQHGHAHDPPDGASVTATGITGSLDTARWEIVTAEETTRTLTDSAGRDVGLADVIVAGHPTPDAPGLIPDPPEGGSDRRPAPLAAGSGGRWTQPARGGPAVYPDPSSRRAPRRCAARAPERGRTGERARPRS